MLRIGIVGCGAIGTSLANIITKIFFREAKVVALFDLDRSKAQGLSRALTKKNSLAKSSLSSLLQSSQLIIEAASAHSSFQIAKHAVASGKDVMIMSVGGIAQHYRALYALAQKRKARIYIPSGAISGIDAVKACAESRITNVVLTTRKNPAAFKNVRYLERKNVQLDKIKKDTVLFYGPAKQAVKFFPQNINVAAVLSLAGVGLTKTKVRIIASPCLRSNIHEISVESAAGVVVTTTNNIVHPDNPKTSFLAVLSATAMLRRILSPVVIGS
ncbi:MAG: DUF108 domain-containing protein [Candidatus Omnitrophica bacterium]|nr:DUF108 domain-containing protein [Candidatus Omnitrophota bacterium]